MDKKVLKWYETPAVEVVELEIEGFLCASEPSTNAEGVEEDPLD